jgi:hypothetical protein
MDNGLYNKLKKLHALAEQGVGGEAENANFILEALLEKHGLNKDEIFNRREAEFFYKTRYEKKLLIQLVGQVTGCHRVEYSQARNSQWLEFLLTEAEVVEVSTKYEAYKPALQETFENAFLAFLSANDVFVSDDDGYDAPPLTPDKRKQLLRILAMASGVDVVSLTPKLKSGE